MVALTAKDIDDQLSAVDQEAIQDHSGTRALLASIQTAIDGSKAFPLLKADVGFRLGILLGYRLAEAKIMTQMLEGK